MAKTVKVKLKADSEWVEVEVANFYDPEKHHTVRLPGSAKKIPYALMEIGDQVYDKIAEEYITVEREKVYQAINLIGFEDLTNLPFADNSVKRITADMVLQKQEKKDLINIMKEIHRVLAPMGKVNITVPCYPSVNAFSNPEYLTVFTPATFGYFYPSLFANFQQTITRDDLQVVFYK